MDCQRIDSILDEHIIGAISVAERSEADGHLRLCRRCADAWLSHEVLAADVPGAPRQGLFEEIAREAGSRAVAAPAEKRAMSRRAAWVTGAAAALVAAVLIAWNANESRVPRQSAREVAPTQAAPASAAVSPGGTRNLIPDARFVAGRDYERLAVPAATGAEGRIEVSEFFVFWCIHCFELEPELEAWSKTQPDYVDLVRVPALFNGTARLQAQAFYTAQALGLLDTIRGPFYEEIHVRGNPLATKEAIRRFFARFGVDEERFDQVFESLGVQADLQRAEELNRRYRVSATPSIGVNGKYLTNASMTGSNETMLEVVDSLVQAEARELCDSLGQSRCRATGRASRSSRAE